jgi:glycosyltransferase involved in cell wall biosynthesis
VDLLYLNNFNYRRGGAESVFLDEARLMEKRGHAVHVLSRHHAKNIPCKYDKFFIKEMKTDTLRPTIEGMRSLPRIFYSIDAKKHLRDLLNNFHVDVAHAHNIYGGLTTSVLDLLSARGIPTFLTLHDYKIICPSYKFMCKNRICEDCKSGNFYMAVLNSCHKNSLIASIIYAMESYFNQWFNKYSKNIHCFVAPSIFMKNKIVEFGWPKEKVRYVPNFLNLSDFTPNYTPGDYYLYLCRLSSEKGISNLISTFKRIKHKKAKLFIVGDGPLKGDMEKLSADDTRITFKGYLSGSTLEDITKNALSIVVPSEWYENAPISILEAMGYGKPVIGSKIGGIPEMIEDGASGYLYQPGNSDDLHEKLEKLLDMQKKHIEEMGRVARQKVENEYNAHLHYAMLHDLYFNASRKYGRETSRKTE